MSLMNRGPETVTVYPTVQVDDGYGGTIPGPGDPVQVRAHVIPSTTEQYGETGYVAGAEYRVYARSLPAGPWSQVDWAGETWMVTGAPERYRNSRRTTYDEATISRR